MLSETAIRAMRFAASRERGNYCPIVGIHGSAETLILRRLEREGFIAWDGKPWQSAPRVSEKARAFLASIGESA